LILHNVVNSLLFVSSIYIYLLVWGWEVIYGMLLAILLLLVEHLLRVVSGFLGICLLVPF
jgi:hypothetical protein